jgi:hypothetical protein
MKYTTKDLKVAILSWLKVSIFLWLFIATVLYVISGNVGVYLAIGIVVIAGSIPYFYMDYLKGVKREQRDDE